MEDLNDNQEEIHVKEMKTQSDHSENKADLGIIEDYDSSREIQARLNTTDEENKKKGGLLCERVCSRIFVWILVLWVLLVLISTIGMIASLSQPISY